MTLTVRVRGKNALRVALLAGCLLASRGAHAEVPVRPLQLEVFGGIHGSDYSTQEGSTRAFGGVQLAAGLTLDRALKMRFDAMAGRFSSGEHALALATRLYAQTPGWLLGVGHVPTFVSGFSSHALALHGEVYEGSQLTVTSSLGVELQDDREALKFGELLLRIYPRERWLIGVGVSYASTEIKQTRGDILLHAQHIVGQVQGVQVAPYVQYGGNLFTRASAGILVYFDELSFAARERRDGLFGARFR